MSYAQNASNYRDATRRMAAASPVTQTERERVNRLFATRATFDHLFTDTAERVSVLHKIASDWTDIHGLDSTPSLDYQVERLTAQIETKRAQLLQEGDTFTEPTYRDEQYH
jgi:hypothetical protein